MTSEAKKNQKAIVPENRRRGALREIADWVKYILFAFLFALLINQFVLQRNEVVGVSMQPTLHNGDHVWTQKVTKLWRNYSRGEIVTIHGDALKEKAKLHEDLVKRVIGVPGDHIEIKDGKVYLNGSPMDEPYLAEGTMTYPFHSEKLECDVPDGYYFVMGDNRENSKDSRHLGFINEDAIMGQIFFRTWPLDRAGGLN